jgi:hypothetical protein
MGIANAEHLILCVNDIAASSVDEGLYSLFSFELKLGKRLRAWLQEGDNSLDFKKHL